ncbi:hypothetical protein JHK82_018885 [Glycine max]|nr:hypothetical protein JHK85_019327 [Glycine max]KAG5038066.1 hypothetical protein JHK86_018906 [Glycine max]KAG5143190.1 hypothetical protein JHK82_018885 [Glycine max]
MTGGLCCGGCGSVSMFGVKRDFHIWEIVYFLLAIDVLVHALVVEAVHQKQQVALPRQSDWWMKQLVVFVEEDVVQFPCLELSEMWRQCLDELKTVLDKFLNLLGTNSCSDSYVQYFLELVG